MNVLANLVRVVTATVGAGTVTLGAAAAGWLTFAQGGLTTGAVVTYAIEDANGGHEIGRGTYTAAGLTLSRDLIYRSTGAGNNTAISLSGSAQVYVTAAAEDLPPCLPLAGGSLTQPLPALLGTAAQAGVSRAPQVIGNYAYCTNAAVVQSLEIFDITLPAAPIKIGGIDLPAAPLWTLAVAGQIAYVPVNSTTVSIQIVDVSNPRAPTVIRGFNAGIAVGPALLSGNYLYVGQAGAGTFFRIIDVSDPANPVNRSGLFQITGVSGIVALAVQGKYVFVGGGQGTAGVGGLYVLDVSDPTTPVLVATYNAVSAVRGVTAAGKYLYLSESVAANGLEVVDISDPTAPVQVRVFATFGPGSNYGNPIIAGSYLFLGNTSVNGVQTINIADPANPVSVGTSPTTLGITWFTISGNKLYVTANATLRIYELNGVDTPSARVGGLNVDILNVDGPSYFAGDIFTQRSVVAGQINANGMVSATTMRSVGNALLGSASVGTLNPAQAMLHVGAAAATARAYNSYTDTSNGEWAYLGDWSANVARYGTDKNGTGVARNVQLLTGGIVGLAMNASQLIALGPSAAFTSSFPALKRNAATLEARLGDDSDYAQLTAQNFVSFYASATLNSAFSINRSAGSLGVPTPVPANQYLGEYDCGGWNGTAYNVGVSMASMALELFSGTARGTELQFWTTPLGGTATAQRLSIRNGVIVGAPTGGDKGAGTLNAVTVYGNNVVLTSDERAKRDIEPLPDCLALVKYIDPKMYRWRPLERPAFTPRPGRLSQTVIEAEADIMPPGFQDRKHWGFVAQDVAKVMREAGYDFGGHVEDEAGFQGLSYNDLVAVLWKAVQELSAKVEGRA